MTPWIPDTRKMNADGIVKVEHTNVVYPETPWALLKPRFPRSQRRSEQNPPPLPKATFNHSHYDISGLWAADYKRWCQDTKRILLIYAAWLQRMIGENDPENLPFDYRYYARSDIKEGEERVCVPDDSPYLSSDAEELFYSPCIAYDPCYLETKATYWPPDLLRFSALGLLIWTPAGLRMTTAYYEGTEVASHMVFNFKIQRNPDIWTQLFERLCDDISLDLSHGEHGGFELQKLDSISYWQYHMKDATPDHRLPWKDLTTKVREELLEVCKEEYHAVRNLLHLSGIFAAESGESPVALLNKLEYAMQGSAENPEYAYDKLTPDQKISIDNISVIHNRPDGFNGYRDEHGLCDACTSDNSDYKQIVREWVSHMKKEGKIFGGTKISAAIFLVAVTENEGEVSFYDEILQKALSSKKKGADATSTIELARKICYANALAPRKR